MRLLGVGVSNLQPKVMQMNLWETDADRERRLLTALDKLREDMAVISCSAVPGLRDWDLMLQKIWISRSRCDNQVILHFLL